ncbi:hypothetical protein [Ruficoccus sp. ZRK36]|uniref:hypothetical protein n=1 Tax=Ruficoccus sp. ZRK36 TaxID=2866311 RepID=UPI001C72EA9F|nr:hypothetical protein [Ruficoccus sp. ZRK36]QYY35298.1 hypothetical protein K0V07_13480 [Ruficoccus sp. ZRK36]
MSTVKEVVLAERLGLPRSQLKALRDNETLKSPAHWHLEHSHIVYTTAGVEALQEALKIGEPSPAPTAEDPAEATASHNEPVKEARRQWLSTHVLMAEETLTELIVTKVYPRNPRCLQARLDGDPHPHTVRVRDNRNFVPGMKLMAVKGPTSGVWNHRGRCPRRKGHW